MARPGSRPERLAAASPLQEHPRQNPPAAATQGLKLRSCLVWARLFGRNAAFRLPIVRRQCNVGLPAEFRWGARFGSVNAAFLPEVSRAFAIAPVRPRS